jgi:hypothetical protein
LDTNEGTTLVGMATEWMRAEGIGSASRMANLLAPV